MLRSAGFSPESSRQELQEKPSNRRGLSNLSQEILSTCRNVRRFRPKKISKQAERQLPRRHNWMAFVFNLFSRWHFENKATSRTKEKVFNALLSWCVSQAIWISKHVPTRLLFRCCLSVEASSSSAARPTLSSPSEACPWLNVNTVYV